MLGDLIQGGRVNTALPPLHIDYETRSAVDLRKTSVYRYAEDLSTDVWCACYAFGDEPWESWSPWRDGPSPTVSCPPRVAQHIRDGGLLVAHNRDFERILTRYVLAPRYGWPEPRIEQWDCTAARAAALALPRSLGEAAWVMGQPEQKDDEGKKLMMKMAKPRRRLLPNDKGYNEALAAWKNGDRRSVTLIQSTGQIYVWWYSSTDLEREIVYCGRDVDAERGLDKRIRHLSPSEHRIFLLDAEINDRGLMADFNAISNAKRIVTSAAARLDEAMLNVTDGFCVPSQVERFVEWLGRQGVETESIDKENIELLLARTDLPPKARRAIEIRAEAARTSTKKLWAFEQHVNADGRFRGIAMFLGAHTGRWAGKGVQVQNFPRPTNIPVDFAMDLIVQGKDADYLSLFFPPMQAVSECLRGAIRAAPGHLFMAGDFSNIEGRVNAWLAGETWKLQAFMDYDTIIGLDAKGKPIRKGRDLYFIAAEKGNGLPPGSITDKEDPRRQHGKVSELACGYQGGIGAFQNMAKNYRLFVPPKEANRIKNEWRAANPMIVASWELYENAAIEAVEDAAGGAPFGKTVEVLGGKVAFKVHGKFLWLRLPSGRLLAYCRPEVRERTQVIEVWDDEQDKLIKREMTKKSVSFWGVNSQTKKWSRQYAYGGYWCENIVQAASRDLLTAAMERVANVGMPIVMHAHDEIVVEMPEARRDEFARFINLMSVVPPWAVGLPLSVEGWVGNRYRK